MILAAGPALAGSTADLVTIYMSVLVPYTSDEFFGRDTGAELQQKFKAAIAKVVSVSVQQIDIKLSERRSLSGRRLLAGDLELDLEIKVGKAKQIESQAKLTMENINKELKAVGLKEVTKITKEASSVSPSSSSATMPVPAPVLLGFMMLLPHGFSFWARV